MRGKWQVTSVWIIIFGVVSSLSFGISSDIVLDRHLVKDAQAIFAGDIVDIQYKTSSPLSEGGRGIPHTFITFLVNEVFKGNLAAKETLTLRFQGGLTKDGLVLDIENVPYFQIGDEGIFFVQNSEAIVCPLVGWEKGVIRVVGDEIFNNAGQEVLLSDNPLYAARIHPRDILDYDKFFERVSSSQRRADTIVWDHFAEETKALIVDKMDINLFDPIHFRFSSRPKNLTEIGPVPRELMPVSFRSLVRNHTQALVYRDINMMLLKQNLFTPADLEGVNIPAPLLEKLKAADKLQMEDQALLNRRLLEQLYPDLLVRSLDQTILYGRLSNLEQFHQHKIGDHTVEWIKSTPEDREETPQPPDPIPAKRIGAADYLQHLQNMITVITTPEELKNLPPITSIDIANEIILRPSIPVLAQEKLIIPDPSLNIPSQDEEEVKAFMANENNPVLKNQ